MSVATNETMYDYHVELVAAIKQLLAEMQLHSKLLTEILAAQPVVKVK